MKKLFLILSFLMLMFGSSACTTTVAANTVEQQREHAREAQEELKNDTRR
jgi:peptidoglycan hydrolase CwlO-like protein